MEKVKDMLSSVDFDVSVDDWREVGTALAICEKSTNALVGSVTTYTYPSKTGDEETMTWLGNLVVHPEYRSRGAASILLDVALSNLPATTTTFLDASPQGHHLYEKHGFRDVMHIMTLECKGAMAAGHALRELRRRTGSYSDGDVRPVSTERDIEIVEAMDEAVFGAPRANLIEAWRTSCTHGSYVDDNAYALAHRRGRTLFVGPCGVVSSNAGAVEEELLPPALDAISRTLGDCLLEVEGGMADKVMLYVPKSRTAWRNWLCELGFHEHDETTTRMSLGDDAPREELPIWKGFVALGTLDFG